MINSAVTGFQRGMEGWRDGGGALVVPADVPDITGACQLLWRGGQPLLRIARSVHNDSAVPPLLRRSRWLAVDNRPLVLVRGHLRLRVRKSESTRARFVSCRPIEREAPRHPDPV